MSLLNSVQTGKKLKPLAIMLHATHGIGKSTFATEAPKPIFVGSEENDELNVARMPKVKTWQDLEDQLKTLRDEKHDFKTLVLDTADGLQQIAEHLILSEKGEKAKSIEAACGGYGKGPSRMANMFLNIRDNYLVPLRDNKGMNIVVLCHSKKVKNEEAMTLTSYDHYETALHKKVQGIFEDWVSAIFFANYYLVRAETSSGKEYAEGADGLRMIYTEERPSHVAKNRFNMPYEIEFKRTGTWNVIKNHVLEHFKKEKEAGLEGAGQGVEFEVLQKVNELKAQIEEKLPKVPAEIQASVKTGLERAGTNVTELERILKKIQAMLS